ncbi:hypothetical protein GCM10010156_49590 [Planobispora rosea]|uniref:Uncharacterized protein n=1 Tax=Planobispora rosea TaxID=35762 RepID=A0A8J3S5F8_PLARO|nr:hypothetical protein [Planobispora rosea]GGS85066.1 hypothetical protein GCM10010156_49590 [Planobispora rosea]GIH86470.1 hypothetical protein Pro02_48780 [Planobispora rosea]
MIVSVVVCFLNPGLLSHDFGKIILWVQADDEITVISVMRHGDRPSRQEQHFATVAAAERFVRVERFRFEMLGLTMDSAESHVFNRCMVQAAVDMAAAGSLPEPEREFVKEYERGLIGEAELLLALHRFEEEPAAQDTPIHTQPHPVSGSPGLCPTCGRRPGVFTGGDADSATVPACCASVTPTVDGAAMVLIQDGKLTCPYDDCGAADDIVELEVASRTNELTITEPGLITVSLGDGGFETDAFECQRCGRGVSLPDGYAYVHSPEG